MENNIQKGGISVETQHIFPIIKQWLYSEKEIFLREIVSNACDAVTKHKRLVSLGQAESTEIDYRIAVTVDPEEKTLTVSDNGIGMTEDELKKYICQIALSGAVDFIQNYEGEDGGKNGIIGHFGLGFYSAFMVADTVEVISRSYTGAAAVHWVCNEAGEYELYPDAVREQQGTDVVLHLTEDCEEYLTEAKIRDVLDKYCAFLPIPVYLTVLKAEEEEKTAEAGADGEPEEAEAPSPINDVTPLWLRAPGDCKDEEYIAFYHKVFRDYKEPLFWIHISADYPLNFKGILYFPRLSNEYDSLEGQVKLYYNQVFVADNIKEVIPEYLLMLKGVLDCPELPLNVSRSYLQNSGYVAKISAHITKKVADKLNALMNTDREKYEALWGDIRTFVEYACMRDRKFYDRVKPSVLLPLVKGGCKTLEECLDKAKDLHEGTVYYANDPIAQAQYIGMFEEQGIEVVLLDKMLDGQFINLLESDGKVHFLRVDADVASALKGEGTAEEDEGLTSLFRTASGSEGLKVTFETLKDETLPAILNLDEKSRRFEDMMRMYSMDPSPAAQQELTLVVNMGCPLIQKLRAKASTKEAEAIAKQIYTLALLAQRQLSASELRAFLTDSYGILETTLGE